MKKMIVKLFIPSFFSFCSLLWFSVQVFLISSLAYYIVIRRLRKRRKETLPKLTDEERDAIISNWKPDPLVPDDPTNYVPYQPVIKGKVGKYVILDDKKYFNMATMNFLGFVGDERVEEVAERTIFKYGVGSCGPRSFYGTVDVHIDFEKQLAKFMGCDEAILYSYGFATIASAIPAYAKKGDVVFVDKCVNFAIQKGIQASRSRVEWFDHNDMQDLERLLIEQEKWAKKNKKKAKTTRLFMIVEGLYAKSADICPLLQLIELKWKYKVRIFMDESLSFGVLGDTGKGVTEHFGIDIIDVDMIMITLENALATTGGACLGRKFLIEHQRLLSLGYVFSASLPPLLTTAASKALEIIEEEPERIQRLQKNSKLVHSFLLSACKDTDFEVIGFELSPLKHIVLRKEGSSTELLDLLVKEIMSFGVLVTRARYLDKDEAFPVQQSVKVTCNSEMSAEELEIALDKIDKAMKNIS